jgi:hypothetical protein
MTTRTIVTSQPDLACDVCERRLLRGEQPEVFVGQGRRLLVCELCAPRAANDGWQRERDGAAVAMPAVGPRRGRSLLERLPVLFRGRSPERPPAGGAGSGRRAEAATGAREEDPLLAFDFLDRPQDAGAPGEDVPAGEPSAPDAHPAGGAAAPEEWVDRARSEQAPAAAPAAAGEHAPPPYLQEAVDAFNASEFPRRVAGVARSLGPPEVSVRSAEHLASVVRIVVAWELCWYRYEVDLSDGIVETRVLEQGTELSELPREDRLANAATAEAGALVLVLQ